MNLATTDESLIGNYRLEGGVNVDVYSFNTTDFLQKLFLDLNITAPDRVEKIAQKYADYHIAVIRAKTRPPIDGEHFNDLKTAYPEVVEELSAFVSENPKVSTIGFGYKNNDIVNVDPWMLVEDNEELRSLHYSIHENEYRQYFISLVGATYGLGELEGFELSMELPFYNGKAYFPLGTSPAWNEVTDTRVVFEIDDGRIIDFDRGTDEVFTDGKHYYLWDFSSNAPGYDLEGEVKDASIDVKWVKLNQEISEWVYDNSPSLGLISGVLLFFVIWLSIVIVIFQHYRIKLDKKAVVAIIPIVFLGFTSSMCLSIFISIPVVVIIVKRKYGISHQHSTYYPRSK